jgi:predicted amidophosphoribosyltransferase
VVRFCWGGPVELFAALADLVLPASCVGCGAAGGPLCRPCAREVWAGPGVAAAVGPLPCLAAGPYEGVLRDAILHYKERGRRGLAGFLGATLGRAVSAGWPDPAAGPVVLVPVPGTAKSIRARQGDHMLRLARHAERYLRSNGYPVAVVRPLRARPKADSAGLDREQRAAAARHAFAPRSGWSARLRVLGELTDYGAVVLVDDVLTTGSTLAAVASVLSGVGVPVTFAATLAVTRLRTSTGGSLSPDARIPVAHSWDGDDEVARRG